MRLALIAAAALAFASAPAALAQDAAAKTDPAAMPTHEMCKSVMGKKMDGKQPHDHGRDKTGHATWPDGKRLSKAEMEKMHARCAEKMAAEKAPAK